MRGQHVKTYPHTVPSEDNSQSLIPCLFFTCRLLVWAKCISEVAIYRPNHAFNFLLSFSVVELWIKILTSWFYMSSRLLLLFSKCQWSCCLIFCMHSWLSVLQDIPSILLTTAEGDSLEVLLIVSVFVMCATSTPLALVAQFVVQ